MKYKEFLDYLETNLDGYHTFTEKALVYQKEKNSARPTKKRWEEDKLQRATYDMWKKAMEPLYNNLKQEIKSGVAQDWVSYIENHEILEITNDGITTMDFNE